MSDKQYKLIRKQLRNVVQDELQYLLHEETFKNLYKDLVKHTDKRLDDITKTVKDVLDNMDKRSQDIQSYVVRNTGVPTAPKTE
jgi:hypothetical protein